MKLIHSLTCENAAVEILMKDGRLKNARQKQQDREEITLPSFLSNVGLGATRVIQTGSRILGGSDPVGGANVINKEFEKIWRDENEEIVNDFENHSYEKSLSKSPHQRVQ